jgi:drug/metabolite transporter (DMT)-like permease
MRVVLLLVMAVWGGNLSVVKWLLLTLDPLIAALLRMLIAVVALWVWWWWQGGRLPAIRPRLWAQLAGCAFVMLYLNQILFTVGMQHAAAANAALVIALNPLVAALLAAALLGDRLTGRRLAGVVLGFAGVAAVVLNRPGAMLGAGSLGDALVFGSVLTWVSSGMLVRRLARELDTALISTLVTTLGAGMLALHVALDPQRNVPPLASLDVSHWGALLMSGLLASAVGALAWNRALVTIGVARTALYAYWVPIFGVLFAVALLGEPLTVWHGVGLAAVLGGTWLGTQR